MATLFTRHLAFERRNRAHAIPTPSGGYGLNSAIEASARLSAAPGLAEVVLESQLEQTFHVVLPFAARLFNQLESRLLDAYLRPRHRPRARVYLRILGAHFVVDRVAVDHRQPLDDVCG